MLVGNSVRYLAQSAHAAGIPVIGADGFADLDTQFACRELRCADSVEPGALLRALQKLDVDDSVSWSYGAGFEAAPGELAGLFRRRRNLLGNDPKVLQLLAEPERLFALLTELDIDCPETLQQPPPTPDGWLFKTAGRCGGLGVMTARSAGPGAPTGYYQAFKTGPLCSLLFMADGRDMQPVGYNCLVARYPAAGDFRFAGAISGVDPTAAQRDVMTMAAQRLTRALGLRGANGLDFVLHKGKPLLLELNARPPATLELYESVLPRGGLVSHLEACRGHLPTPREDNFVRGMRIVYARRTLHMGWVDWPSWVSDRPAEGVQVKADRPLCTVHAAGGSVESVAGRLREHADTVSSLVSLSSEEAA